MAKLYFSNDKLVAIIVLLSLLFIGFGCAGPEAKTNAAVDALQVPQEQTDTAGFDQGMLWQVKKANHAPSYVFGTIHSEDARVTELAEAVVSAFKQANVFAMEVLLNEQSGQDATAAMFFTDDRNLESVAGKVLYQRSVTALASQGISQDQVFHMKPWAVFTLLSMPKPKTGLFLDVMLLKSAKRLDMKVMGLESMKEQIAVFDKMSEAFQLVLLKDTLDNYTNMGDLFEKMISLYLKGDLKEIMQLNSNYMALTDDEVAADFEQRLITDRNHRMVQRILPLIDKDSTFVAVGALHLPGQHGILNLLQKQGYELKALH